ncbi:glycosyltransferase family 4 protein [Bacillus salipaludis]|uniref:Glycosyltransferase family 4 protein n=1 Tax=Bacillus salipaludis TaxID=2547811 RepID=A0AA90R3P6_9BACI|nr:glycosyltransferase family 4 protein [Bacillus salipaludis]MDQ6595008.1 glycosyltransferase family 4 protein [Bacillus salipaludis]
MDLIKVLFFDQSARMGGAEKVLFDLLENINRSKIYPILVSPSGELANKVRGLNIECIELMEFENVETTRKRMRIRDIFKTIKLVYKLNNIINDVQPDILFTNSVKAHVLVNYKKRRIPSIIRLHDYPSSFGSISVKILKNALNNVDKISCVSQSVANDLGKLFPNCIDKLKVTYNGIYKKTNNCKKHFKKPRVVVAGWLFSWKGFDTFIEAMEKLSPKIPDWEFVIAGEAARDVEESLSYKELLYKRVNSSLYKEKFVLNGGYKSLEEIICCSEHCIFVQPSIKPDPLPTVILEASTLAVPTVASDLGGSKEIIEDMVSGRLISPHADELANSVMELVSDLNLRVKYGNKMNFECNRKFSMENYIRSITETIENIIR